MPEQKKKISELCLTGFILSVLSPVLLILSNSISFRNENEIVFWGLIAIAILSPLVGLVLSIVGLATARKKDRKGKGFGIAGIILTGVYTVLTLTVVLIGAVIGGLFFSVLAGHKTDKTIPTYYSDSEIVAVRYYHRDSEGGYRIEELDEDRLDEFVDDLNSMEIHTGGMMDYYWGGSFGVEMELEDGTYLTYDGTRLELYRRSRLDDDFSYDDRIRNKSEYIQVLNYDFWEVAEEYFPSIEENGDNVFSGF